MLPKERERCPLLTIGILKNTFEQEDQVSMDAAELWKTVRKDMMQQLSKPSFVTWIEPLVAVELNEENLIIEAESNFHKQWLCQRYEEQINTILNKHSTEKIKAAFIVKNEPVKDLTTASTREDELFEMLNELKIRVENLEEEVKRLKG